MALLGNGYLALSPLPMSYNGGAVGVGYPANNRAMFARGDRVNQFSAFGQLSGTPSGCRHPVAWIHPIKPGALSSRNTITGSGNASATGQSGYNLDGTLYVGGSGGVDQTQTFLGLIISLVATVAGTGTVSSAAISAITNMIATISGSSAINATAAGLADMAALLEGEAIVNPNNTALMTIAATLRGYSDLTPEGIRDNVWNAILVNYDDAGTAGLALSTASSGGVDYNLLAQAVWEYVTRTLTSGGGGGATAQQVWEYTTRTLTEAAGLTTAEHNQLMAIQTDNPTAVEISTQMLSAAQVTPIHSQVEIINGVTLVGSGTPADPMRPA